MKQNSFILKGNIVYSKSLTELKCVENGYLVCIDGLSCGVYENIPFEYKNLELIDYTGNLIIPGMVDLHIHAPQFAFRGTGMDLELIDWLNTYTFKEESKYSDLEYAKKAYSLFAEKMKYSATTRAVIFATKHAPATTLLMDLMDETGLVSCVGKINMDRASIPELQDKDFLDSAYTTWGWINSIVNRYENTYPIITPRFIPSCSDELLNELREIVKTYNIPVQSHLSENLGEIEWVKELCPKSKFYGDAYDMYDLFGSLSKTIMAHCVYSSDEEIDLIKKNGVFIAHCPSSNVNLSSGIAPIRKYLNLGLNIGLGSDVAGGESESMFKAIVETIKVSKLYWRLKNQDEKFVSFNEAFYLATLGGGKFFGNVGSFEKGYEFDCIVLDDRCYPLTNEMKLENRLERAVYLGVDEVGIVTKYVRGKEIKW